MKCVGLFQAGILLDFSEGDSPGELEFDGWEFPGWEFSREKFP